MEHPPTSLAMGKKMRSFQNQETRDGPPSLSQIPQNPSPLLHRLPPQRHHHSLRRAPTFLQQHPIIHAKMHHPSSMRFKMPRIPCINHPQVDFDYDFESNGDNDYEMNCDFIDDDDDGARKSFLKGGNKDDCEDIVACDDEGIDLKAEQFIAKFYKQMKMQRQVSYLRCNEMIDRGTN